MEYEKNNKDRVPFEHYKELFAAADSDEIAFRCELPFDKEKNEFTIKLMDKTYKVGYPEFYLKDEEGNNCEAFNVMILIMRYMLEGKASPASEKTLTYHDVPWGETYFRQFEGRCIKRMAYAYGYKLKLFAAAMQALGAEKVAMADEGYKLEFLNGLYIYFLLWAADDEFDPSCQILFSDNFPLAFTAEDIAVVGDISIGRIKQIAATL